MSKTVRWFSENGNHCHAVIKHGKMIDRILDEHKIKPSYLNTWVKLFPIISAVKLAKIINAHKIDYIHIHL